MKGILQKIKLSLVGLFSILASWLGILFIPVIIMVTTNLIDYATGLWAIPYRGDNLSSYKSIRGIFKKIGMWLLVAIGAILDWLIKFASDSMGLDLHFNFVIASVVAIWIIVNELISILENLNDIGVPLPGFLMKLAKYIKAQTENKISLDSLEDSQDSNDK